MPPKIHPLPPLAPVQRIERPLTGPEYYHACIGQHPHTLIKPREVVAVLEGTLDGQGQPQPDWQAALDQAVAANPGSRLRLIGKRQKTRWCSDGQPPKLRFEPDCTWDGRSSAGDDFIFATPLSLEQGCTGELIIAGQNKLKVIVRFHHAVMDGMGVVHFLQEIFRALRGEPLLGSNATYTDLELMRHIPSRPRPFKFTKPLSVTGAPQGSKPGGQWQRITLPGSQPHLIPRIAQIVAEHARNHAAADAYQGIVRIALPVSLKRHTPELLATTNFTSMMYLDVAANADDHTIKHDLDDALERNLDTNYPNLLEAIRYLPFTWLDRMVSLTDRNYTHPRLAETAVLSVMSPFRRSAFSCAGFRAETLYGLPQKENTFIVIVGFQGKFELLVGMSNVFASAGRLDAFIEDLRQKLTPPHAHGPLSGDSLQT